MATTAEREGVKRADPVAANAGKAESSGLKGKITIGIGAVVLLLALIWGVQKFMYSRGHESTDDAAIDGHIVPVVAKVGGYVSKVNVNENDHVTEGQLLVQLDTVELT